MYIAPRNFMFDASCPSSLPKQKVPTELSAVSLSPSSEWQAKPTRLSPIIDEENSTALAKSDADAKMHSFPVWLAVWLQDYFEALRVVTIALDILEQEPWAIIFQGYSLNPARPSFAFKP